MDGEREAAELVSSRAGRWNSRRRLRSIAHMGLGSFAVARALRYAPLILGAFASLPERAVADEGGVSFWTPGQYGSFAAIAPSPGWSLPLVFYNYGGSISGNQSSTRGHLLAAGLAGSFDGLFVVPTYTVGTTILGAVPSFSMALVPAYSAASANVSLGPLSVSARTRYGAATTFIRRRNFFGTRAASTTSWST